MMTKIADAYAQFCEERFPLPDEPEIAVREERARMTFPPEYRAFLLEYNGGYFRSPTITSPGEPCPTDSLHHLQGIGASHPTAELCRQFDLDFFGPTEHPDTLIIGWTNRNYILLLVIAPGDEDHGNILLRTFTETFWLADNLEEFFGLLTE